MKRIRKGDEIYVRSGRDKGKRGTVLRVLDENRVLVEGVHVVKRHTKPNPQAGMAGGIIEKEAPIHISNVALFNPVTKRPDRIGVKTLEDDRKVRFFKSNNEVVDI
ncbi:MAG: 50S ribosomal protein L24 [Gammaproteobacteria bacterium]|jgi:large subunit ribosomal protein L24|nr:50S ribosomal protein L24 [Gammaproteobacteria bacterium]